MNGVFFYDDGPDDGGDAYKQEDVDDVATDDVTYKDVCAAADEGAKGNGKLGGTGAKGNDSEAD